MWVASLSLWETRKWEKKLGHVYFVEIPEREKVAFVGSWWFRELVNSGLCLFSWKEESWKRESPREMWLGRGNTEKKEGGNPLVAVAIDKDKGSQSALKWAIDNILNRGQTVVLIHVKLKQSHSHSYPSISFSPSFINSSLTVSNPLGILWSCNIFGVRIRVRILVFLNALNSYSKKSGSSHSGMFYPFLFMEWLLLSKKMYCPWPHFLGFNAYPILQTSCHTA